MGVRCYAALSMTAWLDNGRTGRLFFYHLDSMYKLRLYFNEGLWRGMGRKKLDKIKEDAHERHSC